MLFQLLLHSQGNAKKKGGQLNFRPKIVSRQKTRGKHFKLLVIFKCKTLTLGIIRINKGCIHLLCCVISHLVSDITRMRVTLLDIISLFREEGKTAFSLVHISKEPHNAMY